MRRLLRPAATVLAPVLIAHAATGCLSNQYRIDASELHRIAALPPPVRGQHVRFVQQLGEDRQPMAYPPPGYPEAPASPEAARDAVDVFVNLNSPGPVRPSGSGRQRSGNWRGGGGGVSMPSGGGKGEELVVLAVIAVVIAATCLVGLAVTEGIRWDGFADLPPTQPLHLQSRFQQERVTTVGDLRPEDLLETESATVVDGEGYPFRLAERAPLDRRGLAFKMDVGRLAAAFDDYTAFGLASNIQLGFFPHQRFGILGTLSLTGGTDRFDRTFVRHALGLEAQVFPVDLDRLHLGAYVSGGSLISAVGDDVSSRPVAGAGAMIELGITTRLAFTLRGGFFTTSFDKLDNASGLVTAGFAIY